MSEKEYRAIARDSYSTLSLFVSDMKGYHRKHVLGREDENDAPTPAQIYGSLVDCLLFTPEQKEERFVEATVPEPPPQMLAFTQHVVRRMIENKNLGSKEGMRQLFLWAYNDTKYDKNGKIVAFKTQTFEKTVERFLKECKSYCKELLSGHGRQMIEQEVYSKAEYAVELLHKCRFTGPILRTVTNNRYRVFKQQVILYDFMGLPMKSMLDLVIVDDVERRVWFFDLKTTHHVESFPVSFLKYKYYLQLGVYSWALVQWMKQSGIGDYVLEPMRFIVMDSYNYMSPLVYATSFENLQESLHGFTVNGKQYAGVYQIIRDLQWHKEQKIWDIAREHYENNGMVVLKPFGNEDHRLKETAIALAS